MRPGFFWPCDEASCAGKSAKRAFAVEHDPEKHALGPRPEGGNRFSEKIMLK
jgi:hypothetical protein